MHPQHSHKREAAGGAGAMPVTCSSLTQSSSYFGADPARSPQCTAVVDLIKFQTVPHCQHTQRQLDKCAAQRARSRHGPPRQKPGTVSTSQSSCNAMLTALPRAIRFVRLAPHPSMVPQFLFKVCSGSTRPLHAHWRQHGRYNLSGRQVSQIRHACPATAVQNM